MSHDLQLTELPAIHGAMAEFESPEELIAACEEALRFQPDLALARNNLEYARQRANASGK